MQTHSSILARESPWTEEPGALQLFWAGYFLSPGARHALLTPVLHLVPRQLLLPGQQGHGAGAEARQRHYDPRRRVRGGRARLDGRPAPEGQGAQGDARARNPHNGQRQQRPGDGQGEGR